MSPLDVKSRLNCPRAWGHSAVIGLVLIVRASSGAQETESGAIRPVETGQQETETGKQPADTGRSPVRSGRPVGLPLRRFGGPGEQLAAVGLGAEQLRQFTDGTVLGSAEEPLLRQLLFRIPQMSWEDLQRWQEAAVDWDAVAVDPERFRVRVFALDGRVTYIEQIAVPASLADPLEFDRYYRVQFTQHGSSYPCSIYAREVPAAWKPGAIDEPARAWGLLLKAGPKEKHPELVFAARRVHWFPVQARSETGVEPDQVLLAKLGMDIGLWDQIRRSSGLKISATDREGLNQLLAACSRADRESLSRQARPFSLTGLLSDPRTWQGRLLNVQANARQITKVQITEAAVRERFGIDHYYQIDGFLPVGRHPITIQGGPTYANSFPVTFCVLRLPPELQAAEGRLITGDAKAEVLNEPILVSGFFYRMWSYRSTFTAEFNDKLPQFAPMFVAVEPEMARREDPQPRLVPGLIGGGLMVVALGLLWYALRRTAAGDAKFLKSRRRW